MRALALLLCAASIAGCVPKNLESLEANSESATLTSTRSWEDSYRVLNARLHQCMDMGGMGHTGGVDGQLYPDRRMGEVIVSYQAGPLTSNTGPLVQAQVTPAPEGGTGSVILLRMAKSAFVSSKLPQWVRLWLDGSTACRPS